MLCLLEILLLLFALNHGDLTVLAHRTAWKRVPKPSVTAAWNTSATSPLIQANGSSHVTPSDIENYNSSRGVINAAPMLPLPFANLGDWNPNKMLVNYQDVKSGFCAIGDDFCSFKDSNGTVTQATATNFSDQCLLWDSSCSGNKTMAIERFFSVSFNQSAIDDPNTNRNIINNNCFGEVGAVSQSDCDIYNPLERLADFEKIRNWMRSPQCVSAANEWITMTGYPWGYVFEGGSNASRADSSLIEPSCCGACWLVVDTVDLYYWPEPDANVSCTSIIGDNLRPLDYGATTTTLDDGDIWTYWAGDCNTTLTSMSFPGTTMIPSTYIAPLTTAMITSIGSLTVKRSFFSPWSSSPCIVDDAGSQPSNRSMEVLNEHASVYAHGHSLVVPSSVTQDNGLPVSTTISGNFTFTSPSMYANFHGINGGDICGTSLLSPIMVSFSAGELSTIGGNSADGYTTKQFNFADIPCPPQSVMEANWYKPEPGEPYRPLVAMPTYDPPIALTAATAVAPPVSPGKPNARPPAPAPSPTVDPGDRQTVGGDASIPVPAGIPTLAQPKATGNAAPAPPNKERPDPGSQLSDPNGDNNPQGGSDPNQASDPQQGNDPTQGSGSDIDPGQGAGAKPSGDPKQGDSMQGSSQIPDSVPQNNPNQINTNPFDDSTEGQAQTINNQVVQPLSHGISIAGTTLTPGALPITVSGTPIQLGSSALIIGTPTVPLAPYSPTQIITTIAGQRITAASNTVAIAGSTLSPGAPGTAIDGTTLSLDTAGQFIVGSKTIPLASNIPETITTTVAGQAITAAPSGVSVAGTTLNPGAPGTTLDGTLLSLDAASHLIIGSKTIPLESASPNSIITTIGGQVITAAPDKIAIAGTALAPGASGVTVGGTLVSLNTAGQLVVGSKTMTLPSGDTGLEGLIMGGIGGESPEVADPITTTIDGHVITAEPTALVMAGTTLTPGAPGFTIDGTVVSLNTAAQLVVGTKTIQLEGSAGSNGETAGLGGSIMGAFGSGGPFGPFNIDSPTQGNSSTGAVNGTGTRVQAFEGNAASLLGRSLWKKMAASVIAMSVLAYM